MAKCFISTPSHHLFTHYLPCSYGNTALKWAIDQNQADVIAYLRSIGAPE